MQRLVETMPGKAIAALFYGQSWKNMDRDEYLKVMADIKRVFIRNAQRNFDVHFYGSRLMGLACQDSDLDTYIDLGKEQFDQRVEFQS